jgi:RNA polymerase sigma factor (sigma-70 family)
MSEQEMGALSRRERRRRARQERDERAQAPGSTRDAVCEEIMRVARERLDGLRFKPDLREEFVSGFVVHVATSQPDLFQGKSGEQITLYLHELVRRYTGAFLGRLRRMQRREQSLDTVEDGSSPVRELADPSPGPEDLAMQEELCECLDAAIAQLPSHQQALVVRHYRKRESITEIAVDLGIRENTAHQYILRARRAIAVELGAHGYDHAVIASLMPLPSRSD